MSEFLRTKMVKTRKPHTCFGCLREFRAGTDMLFAVIKDVDVFDAYLCKSCIEAQHRCGGGEFGRGELRELALEIEAEVKE